MATFKAPRGTKDILPDESTLWQQIESTAQHIFETYNFKNIRTPIFEHTELFVRGIGDDSAIVEKEMYSFKDKGDRDLTLRPEGTASVARSFIQHNLNTPSKFYYSGPMFRYERPQAGRYRQFHQTGVEHLGASHPLADAEIIALAYRLFSKLGLVNLTLKINSIGCRISRPVIEEKIKQFISTNIKKLPDHIQKNFEKNPLRLLDSKDETVQAYLSGMPDFKKALSQKSRDHFNSVMEYLESVKIPYVIDNTLVRGLDYYNDTVFEIVSENLGAQNAVCGGGRYDHLIEELGGKATPAVGFAFGMERVALVMQQQEMAQKPTARFYMAPLGSSESVEGFKLMNKLREAGLICDTNPKKFELPFHFKQAEKIGASHIIIIGEEELRDQSVTIKNMTTREQQSIPSRQLIGFTRKLASEI